MDSGRAASMVTYERSITIVCTLRQVIATSSQPRQIGGTARLAGSGTDHAILPLSSWALILQVVDASPGLS